MSGTTTTQKVQSPKQNSNNDGKSTTELSPLLNKVTVSNNPPLPSDNKNGSSSSTETGYQNTTINIENVDKDVSKYGSTGSTTSTSFSSNKDIGFNTNKEFDIGTDIDKNVVDSLRKQLQILTDENNQLKSTLNKNKTKQVTIVTNPNTTSNKETIINFDNMSGDTNDDNANESIDYDNLSMTGFEKLKNEVYKLKMTTDQEEARLTNEMNSRLNKTRLEMDRVRKDTTIKDPNSILSSLESNLVETKNYYQTRINSIRNELDLKQKELADRQTTKQGMNWDKGNIITLHTWIKDCNKQQFIYDSVLDKLVSRSTNIKIALLILCAIQSLISVSNLGINTEANPYLVWSIKIMLSIVGTIVYILTQYMTLQKFEDFIKSYTSYTENIGLFLSNIASMADIKIDLRPDGNKYILDNKESYTSIFSNSPHISQSDWKDSIDEYNAYLKNASNSNNYHTRKRRAYTCYVVTEHSDNNTDTTKKQSVQTDGGNIDTNNNILVKKINTREKLA
jgi:hypothetical protein